MGDKMLKRIRNILEKDSIFDIYFRIGSLPKGSEPKRPEFGSKKCSDVSCAPGSLCC